MFSKAILVLLATSVALVAGRSHFLMKRGQRECARDMGTCERKMKSYQREILRHQDPAAFIQSATIRQHCSKINGITSCLKNALRGSCSGQLPAAQLDIVQKALSLVDYVCVDQLDAFERNAQCFMNAEFDESLAECQPNIEQCDVSGFVNCAHTAMDATESCTAESNELLEELMTRMIKIIPGCKAAKELRKAFEMVLYLK